MKRLSVAVMMLLLLLSAGSAWAGKYHTVTKGECLWLIGQHYSVRWQAIQRANGLKSTTIFPGQRLLIPEENYVHGNIWRKVGGNPYGGTAKWAIDHFSLPEKVKVQVLKNIQQKKFRWSNIHSGMKITVVTFGKNRIWKNVTTRWDSTRYFATKDYGVDGYHVVKVLWCGNWAWWKEVLLPPLPPTHLKSAPSEKVELKPQAQPAQLPPIFKKEKTRVSFEHELDLGGGLWQNDSNFAKGAWWFGQYKLYLHRLEKNLSSGTWTPEIGVFARGDLGKTDADYHWNNWGIGPQIGLMWNGITEEGYPQQVQIMFRTLWEHLHGKNSSSGYHKDEDHFLLGYYAEYLRQFAPDLMNVLYAEGWVDMDNSFSSSWSGDKASKRSGFDVGYKLHKQWNDDWASRFGIQLGYTPQDNWWGANANIEMRYDDWLIFGPSFDYTLASNIAGAVGGYSYGPFVRIELHKFVMEKYSEYESEGVVPADHNLLKY